MRSVTEQGDLDDFLSTAELAGTDFTAEKLNNVKIIHKDQKNPYLLSATEERTALRKHKANRKRLTVPRRPPWDDKTTPQELDQRERDSLLDWRRGLAELQESDDLLMTPFERNLEVWRQLWRVIERSDLVVQIVDARHPLMFRCEDLENYVKDVDPRKNNLLLVNKADMMTLKQRQAWAQYFQEAGINFRFFSAELAKDLNEARGAYEDTKAYESSDELDHSGETQSKDAISDGMIEDEAKLAEATNDLNLPHEAHVESETGDEVEDEDEDEDEDGGEWESEDESDTKEEVSRGRITSTAEPTRILTTDELEALFLQHAPDIDTVQDGQSRKIQIGLVGYPNVGKSSTINALIGAKKVSVSATPGKTKHFQTIHLSDSVILCDCPGLVFPNFATTKAELVCNGILPIDQLREYTAPAALVAQRIPRAFLEAVYGMKIEIRPLEEGGTGMATGEEVLKAYATARGFRTTGQSRPDESRAARYVLKDYVRGKLLYCHPPPTEPPIDGRDFNHDLYDADHLPQKRRAMFAAIEEASVNGSDAPSVIGNSDGGVPVTPVEGQKTKHMDKRFFGHGSGDAAHLRQPFQHRYSEQGTASGKLLSGRKERTMFALERNIDVAELKSLNSKKHFNGTKRKGKVRGECA